MRRLFPFPAWFSPRSDGRQPVLLYDGECGLCNSVVRFLIRADRAARLRFTPLQGEAGQAYLRANGLPTDAFDTIVFVPDWRTQWRAEYRVRTDGVLAALDEIGGVWRVLSWARVIPAPLRDPLYKLVARARYAVFGTYKPSPLPEASWAKRFEVDMASKVERVV